MRAAKEAEKAANPPADESKKPLFEVQVGRDSWCLLPEPKQKEIRDALADNDFVEEQVDIKYEFELPSGEFWYQYTLQLLPEPEAERAANGVANCVGFQVRSDNGKTRLIRRRL